MKYMKMNMMIMNKKKGNKNYEKSIKNTNRIFKDL